MQTSNVLKENLKVFKGLFPGSGSTGIKEAVVDTEPIKSPAVNRKNGRSLKPLVEAIILQSMEDLWDPAHRAESLNFFEGEGYKLCAEIAGMNWTEKLRVLRILKNAGFKVNPPYR